MLSVTEIADALNRTLGEGHSLAIITLLERHSRIVEPTMRLVVDETGSIAGGTLGDPLLDDLSVRHALKMIADEKQEIAVVGLDQIAESNETIETFDRARLLYEVSRPPLELIICGGGHVGQAVAKVAGLLDFKITVIDDRADFASREKFPDEKVSLIADDFVAGLCSLKITPATHIVIVTRGHRHDEICLHAVVDKPARYIGMIGSRRRTTTIRERLRREGVKSELLRRVHAPIGLDIGAQTPEEIALAVMAEIVLVRRGGTGQLKSAEGPMAKTR